MINLFLTVLPITGSRVYGYLIYKVNELLQYLHGIKEIVEDDLNEKVIQPEIMKYGDDSNVTASDRSIIPKSVDNIERRDTRISLTIRHVPKTKKIKIKL